eukprot:CAMPEP_0115532826 /NCGR_PEP_ID=MMETSP0271-20121206/85786_1 /TAXON_ID=71861 /ORGANISM="Scrippsiella trochoidea, Strain CCMP3099" /LENGTH=53 /DNA_ID=CAMNT_0002965149 /DNA_START=109 /DNA_END=267 /DNA_ORIENTATION=+
MAANAPAESSTDAVLLAKSDHCSSVENAGFCRAPFGKSNIPSLAPPVRLKGST